jgi:quinol monooxygenase YgiN
VYGLVVRFELLEGHEEAFDELVAETLRRIEAEEPGTIAYVTHRVDGEPSARVFYEVYRDEAAFQAHEATAHTTHFLAQRQQHLKGNPEVWFVAPGHGVIREGMTVGDG